MDDELAALMGLFTETQQAKSSARLSERNVIELVNKLQELEMLETLVYTMNGREYLTQDRVKTEVQQAVHACGGRVALADLPNHLNVDLNICTRQASALAAEDPEQYLLVQGEIITPQYFDNLAAEVNEVLQETGQVPMAELALRFSLSSDILNHAISSRMGSQLDAHLEGGLLYTPTHIARITAQIRGALRATSAPVSVANLVSKAISSTGHGSSSPQPVLVSSIVDQLLSEGVAQGVLKGGVWSPHVHALAQRENALAFFKQNNFISLDQASKLGVAQPTKYLQTEHPEGVLLADTFVSAALTQQLDAEVAEALAAQGWCDVASLVPPSFSAEDIALLLQKCLPAAHQASPSADGTEAAVLVLDSVLIGRSVLQECREVLHELARRAASCPASQANVAELGHSSRTVESENAIASKSTEEYDSDDDFRSKGASKKGGKSKSKGGGKGAAPAPPNDKSKKSKGGKAGQHPKLNQRPGGGAGAGKEQVGAPSMDQMVTEIVKKFPDLEGQVGAGDGLQSIPEAVATMMRASTLATFVQTRQTLFNAGAEERRRRRDALQVKLEEVFLQLQLLLKGALFFEEDEADLGLQRNLQRVVGSDTLDTLLLFQSVDTVATNPNLPLSPGQRDALIADLPADVRKSCSAANAALNDKEVTQLIDAIELAAEVGGLRLRRMDKKTEKPALAAFRQNLLSHLEMEDEPAAALALVVPLIYVQVHHRAVSMPGRALATAIKKLKGTIPDANHTFLEGCHTAVVEHLQKKFTGEELVAQLPQLKAIGKDPMSIADSAEYEIKS